VLERHPRQEGRCVLMPAFRGHRVVWPHGKAGRPGRKRLGQSSEEALHRRPRAQLRGIALLCPETCPEAPASRDPRAGRHVVGSSRAGGSPSPSGLGDAEPPAWNRTRGFPGPPPLMYHPPDPVNRALW